MMKHKLRLIAVFLLCSFFYGQSISLSTDSINLQLTEGDSSTQTITITNNTDSAIVLNTSLLRDVIVQSKRSKASKKVESEPAPFTSSVSFSKKEAKIDPFFSKLSSSGNILIIGDGKTETDVQPLLEAAGYSVTLVSDDGIYNGANPSLENFSAVILLDGNNYGSDMPDAGEQAIVDFVTNGGGLILTEWIAYEVQSNRYNILKTIMPMFRTAGFTGTDTYSVIKSHPVTLGLDSAFSLYVSGNKNGIAHSGEVLVTGPQSGDAVVADEVGSGRVVQLATAGNYSAGQPFLDLNMQKLLTNAVNWVSGASWLRFTPENDTIPASSSLDLIVSINTEGNCSELLREVLNIKALNSGDSILFPVHVDVQLIPRISLSGSSIAFGSIFANSESQQNITIFNTGCDTLRISSVVFDGSDVGIDTDVFKVNPKSSVQRTLTFGPTSTGNFDQSMTLNSNDTQNPALVVALTGTATPPPILTISTDSVKHNLDDNSIVQDHVLLSNTGEGTLHYTLDLIDYYYYGGELKNSRFKVVEEGFGPWIVMTHQGDSLAQGESDSVKLEINTIAAMSNELFADIVISSNDPNKLLDTVAVRVNVEFFPHIFVFEDVEVQEGEELEGREAVLNRMLVDTIHLKNTIVGDTNWVSFGIINYGGDTLKFSNITTSGANFWGATTSLTEIQPWSFTLEANGGVFKDSIYFSSQSSGTFEHSIVYSTNDPDFPSKTLLIIAKAQDPPEMTLSKSSYNITLDAGDNVEDQLGVDNSGEADLELSFSFEADTVAQQAKSKKVNQSAWAKSKVRASDGLALSKSKSTFQKSANARFLILYEDGSGQLVSNALQETGLFASGDIDLLSNPSSNFSLNDISQYESILVYTNNTFSQNTLVGDVLKEYVDNGGGVVIATYGLSTSWAMQGGIMQSDYSPFSPSATQSVSGTMDMNSIAQGHPLFDGISSAPVYWTNSNYSNPPLNPGAALLAQDTNGNNFAAINSAGNVLGLVLFPGNIDQGNASAKLLLANSLLVAGKGGIVSVSPPNAIVSNGNHLDAVVTFRSLNYSDTTITGNIRVKSNDPSNQEVDISVSLTINSAPNIRTGLDTVDFDWMDQGDTTSRVLNISNVGSDSLMITSLSLENSNHFSLASIDTTIAPQTSIDVDIEFNSNSIGTHLVNLTIASNDNNEATKVVVLKGQVTSPPSLSLGADSLSYKIGQNMTRQSALTLTNNGGRELFYMAMVTTDSVFGKNGSMNYYNWLSVSNEVMSLDAAESGDLAITIMNDSLKSDTTYEAFIWIESSDDENYFGDYAKTASQSSGNYYEGKFVKVKLEVIDYVEPKLAFNVHYSTEAALSNHLKFYVYANGNFTSNPIVALGSDSLTTSELSNNVYQFDYTVTTNGTHNFSVSMTDELDSVLTESISLNIQASSQSKASTFMLNPSLSMTIPKSAFKERSYVFNRLEKANKALSEKEFVSEIFDLYAASKLSSALSIHYTFPADFTKDVSKTGLYRYNKDKDEWILYDGQGRKNTLTASINEYGKYAIIYDENFVALPNHFELGQNYPNPFNPVTNIPFDVAKRQHVKILIYNVLGQKIKTLVNKVYDRGSFKESWNGLNQHGKQVPSGIYYYQIISESFTKSKNMVLIK